MSASQCLHEGVPCTAHNIFCVHWKIFQVWKNNQENHTYHSNTSAGLLCNKENISSHWVSWLNVFIIFIFITRVSLYMYYFVKNTGNVTAFMKWFNVFYNDYLIFHCCIYYEWNWWYPEHIPLELLKREMQIYQLQDGQMVGHRC